MPWMRVAIGMGGSGLVAGVAGMVAWIDDGSHYFELAVALASAGFLTLVGCVLTRVFGSSHGSQDDAFRRGQSMGYDAGFLEGHRTARPVVVPLHGPVMVPLRSVERDVEQDLAVPSSDIEPADELKTSPTVEPLWGRLTMPAPRRDTRDRLLGWVVARRIVLMAGVLCLAAVAVLVANASVPTPVSAEALQLPPKTPGLAALPPSGSIPAVVSTTGSTGWSVAVGAGGTPGGPGKAGVPAAVLGVVPGAVSGAVPGAVSAAVPGARSAAVPGAAPGAVSAGAAAAQGVQAVGATAVRPVAALSSLPGVGVAAPATFYVPALVTQVSAPVAAPVVPLTAAQKTAADALAAAKLTAANAAAASSLTAADALAASNLTAANAAAAATETARVAAAAAEATRLQALADAYAVAHPAG